MLGVWVQQSTVSGYKLLLVHAIIAESSRLPYEFHKVAYFTLLAKDNIGKGGGGVGCWQGGGGGM